MKQTHPSHAGSSFQLWILGLCEVTKGTQTSSKVFVSHSMAPICLAVLRNSILNLWKF